jgi:TPR repeat protein
MGVNGTNIYLEYKTDLSEITRLAHGLYVIRSKSDDVGRKRPTSCKRVSKNLFIALSRAKEPTATLHILRALYLSPYHRGAKEVARNFSLLEIKAARQVLEELATEKHPDAMTLLGLFWEKEGLRQQAQIMYEEAMKLQSLDFDADADANTPGFQQIAPWNALGLLLQAEKDPESQQRAIEAFRHGALKADDPVSYYHLALLIKEGSGEWLEYMHKAAGSGHQDAMHALGKYYIGVNPKDAAEMKDKKLTRLLKWIFNLGPNRAKLLGAEWLTEASLEGHKPSMMTLASYLETSKDPAKESEVREKVKEMLEKVIAPTDGDKTEQWPELVKEASMRLQELKRKHA